jgi:2-oxoglutarate ferredoxin oxidoreductase subunit alpha
MQESVALAGMTETPVVIIIGQRPARSTGLRPRIGPGEIDFTLHSGHGEFPRVLLAPGSIDEAICLARRSFELADRHQIPVFILTDQYFADSIQITEGSIAPESKSREYRSRGPDCLTHPGPGAAPVKAASGEHDEEGKIPKDPELRIRMLNKRLGKSEKIRGEALLPGFYGDGDAEDILICWGSNKLIVKEAIERLRADGIRIGALHFSQVYPLVPEMTRDYDLGEKRLICIENDATGQFAGLLKRELGLEVEDHILKYNGECFTVEEVCREARKRIISRGQKTLA